MRYANKTELMRDILRERELLEKTIASLSEREMTQRGVCAGGRWTVKDIVAHLTEWEQMFLGWYRAGLRGEVFKTPAPDLNWRQLPLLNQRIYEKHRDRPLVRVMKDFSASHREVLKTVRAIPEKQIFKRALHPWLGSLALVSYIGANTASHYRWARKLIQRWKRKQEIAG